MDILKSNVWLHRVEQNRNEEKTPIWGSEKTTEWQHKNENGGPVSEPGCSLPSLSQPWDIQDQHKHTSCFHLSISIRDLTCQTKETLKNISIFSRESNTPCLPFHRRPYAELQSLATRTSPIPFSHTPPPSYHPVRPAVLCPPLLACPTAKQPILGMYTLSLLPPKWVDLKIFFCFVLVNHANHLNSVMARDSKHSLLVLFPMFKILHLHCIGIT